MGKVQLGWLPSALCGVGWIRFRQKGRSGGRLAEGWLAPDGLLEGLAIGWAGSLFASTWPLHWLSPGCFLWQ